MCDENKEGWEKLLREGPNAACSECWEPHLETKSEAAIKGSASLLILLKSTY